MTDALARGARGAGITIAGQALKVGIQFASVIVVSRLLSPDDIGLIAMVAVFVSFGEMLRDLGMTTVGLQRKDLGEQQASNLFWINTGLGLLTGAALAACAGLIVALYGDERLWWVAPALAPALLLNGMTAQLRVNLARRMKYTALVGADVVPQLINLVATILFALLGFEYWSIVIGTVSSALAALIIAWGAARWRPLRPRRDHESKQLVSDGAAFGLATFLTFLAQNVDTVVIGMRWGSADVGLYSRSYQLLSLPVGRLMGPLTQVVVPTTNAATKEGRGVDEVLLRLQFGLGLLVVGVFALAGGGAQWLIPMLLGPEWVGAVPLFQAMSVGGFFWVLSFVSYWRFILDNKGLQLAFYNLVTKMLTVVAIIVASLFSIQAVAWSVAIALAVSWPINLIWLRRISGQPIWPYLRNGLGLVVPASIVLVLCAWGTEHVVSNGWAALGMLAAGLLVFVALVMAVPGQWRMTRGAITLAGRLRRRTF
ncbi:lipopolysaccharide biosynthesis protein [Microbacterium sp. NPDC055903]